MQNNLMCDMFVLISEGKFKMYSSVEWIIPGQSWLFDKEEEPEKKNGEFQNFLETRFLSS